MRRGSGLEAVMDNSGVEKRFAERMELESLVVGEPGRKQSWTLNSKINTAVLWSNCVLYTFINFMTNIG